MKNASTFHMIILETLKHVLLKIVIVLNFTIKQNHPMNFHVMAGQ